MTLITLRNSLSPFLASVEIALCLSSAHATTLPAGFSEAEVASVSASPTCLAVTPDGTIYVAQQDGILAVWKLGQELSANFFADAPLVTDASGERGLLGIALDPNFAANRLLYLYYTVNGGDHRNRVSRFTADASGLRAVAGSETVIWEGDPRDSAYHNGGAIHFGIDGKLYIATGDDLNGTAAQSLTSQHGKILRINPDGTVPTDNPFRDGSGPNADTIWALGLRNPFTFAVQPGTGRLFINDVGAGSWEEINDGGLSQSGRGLNFGWPETEGDFNSDAFPEFTRPLFAYSHSNQTVPFGSIITGGAFYNPQSDIFGTDFVGEYFFADLSGGWIYRIDPQTKEKTLFASGASAVDLDVTPDGCLYYLSYTTQKVYRVERLPASAPVFILQPVGQTVEPGTLVTLRIDVIGAPALQWQRSSDNGATWTKIRKANGKTLEFTTKLTDHNALFRAVATNAKGSATSNAVQLRVIANAPPAPPVISFNGGLTDGKFVAGREISVAASSVDPEDGILGESQFYWKISLINDTKARDTDRDGLPGVSQQVATIAAASGHFTPSTTRRGVGVNSAYVFSVEAWDNRGVRSSSRQIVHPVLAKLTLTSEPPGLSVLYAGETVKTPREITAVAGFSQTIEAVAPQVMGANSFVFDEWSDGGTQSHAVQVATTPTTLTARYATSILSEGWSAEDIGDVRVTGAVRYTDYFSGNAFAMTGAGAIEGTKDSFFFVHQPTQGDCSIEAVVPFVPVSKRGKQPRLGIMLRAGNSPGSPHVFVGFLDNGFLEVVRRDAPNQTAIVQRPAQSALRARIAREGGTLRVSTSIHGDVWTEVLTISSVQLPTNALIGMAICSGSEPWWEGIFADVTVTP
jgi:glucose/arabinose dehydrogenase